MIRLFTINKGTITEINYEPGNFAPALPVAMWIDVISPTAAETLQLEAFLKASVPAAEDYEELEDSSRCHIDRHGTHVSSLFLVPADGKFETRSVACILRPEHLITIRKDRIELFRQFRAMATRGEIECNSPSELLISLLEQKVENLADMLEGLYSRLETISKPVLGEQISNLSAIVSELALAEDINGKVRLCLMDTQRDILFLQRHLKADLLVNETIAAITKDMETLMSHTTFLFDKINFLMDSMHGFINIQLNNIIKVFSVVSVVFLPPMLVASIYGMNFHFIPELDWRLGYPLALLLMVISGIAPYGYIKRKGWI